MVTVASIQPHAGPGGRIIECCGGSTVYRITRVRRVVSSPSPPPPSHPSFRPFVLSPSSLLVFPPTSRPSRSLLERSISPACILSSKYLDCCRCIGRKRKTQRRPRPITRQPTSPLPPPPRSSEKQNESRLRRNHRASCRRRRRRSLTLVLPAKGARFFDLPCLTERILIPGLHVVDSAESSFIYFFVPPSPPLKISRGDGTVISWTTYTLGSMCPYTLSVDRFFYGDCYFFFSKWWIYSK